MIHQVFVFLVIFRYSGASSSEENSDAADLIAYFKYPVEKHHVTTDDGYIIEMQRIPKGRDERGISGCKTRPVVFFMHGLFSSSIQFILNLPSQSPGFIFADAGFDVWLANVRGTKYGSNHTHLKPTDRQFWNFSLYEHSHYDLRQQVEYVLNETNQESLFYIGHSQGTTVMFQRLAEADATWQKKVRAFFALAPSGGFLNLYYPLHILDSDLTQGLLRLLVEGHLGVYPSAAPAIFTDILAKLCSLELLEHFCAYNFGFSSSLERLAQVNESRTPVYLKHFPNPTSTLNLLSWAQVFKYHELRRLDLGRSKNLEVYGQPEPPSFKYQNIVADTYVFFSKDDIIAGEQDARDIILKNYGPGLRDSFDLDHFTHFDFSIGLRATDEVYRPIISIINNEIQTNSCV